ncbi:MAG TPA: hypothetical protein VIP46_18280, partial [Pyrinomonadaceae bacterium]
MRKQRLITSGLAVALLLAAAAAVGVRAQATTQATTPPPAFAVGQGPEGVATDGTNAYVANQFSNSVTKLAADGAAVATFAVGRRPVAVAFDGSALWVANYLSNDVMKLDPATGALLGTTTEQGQQLAVFITVL